MKKVLMENGTENSGALDFVSGVSIRWISTSEIDTS